MNDSFASALFRAPTGIDANLKNIFVWVKNPVKKVI